MTSIFAGYLRSSYHSSSWQARLHTHPRWGGRSPARQWGCVSCWAGWWSRCSPRWTDSRLGSWETRCSPLAHPALRHTSDLKRHGRRARSHIKATLHGWRQCHQQQTLSNSYFTEMYHWIGSHKGILFSKQLENFKLKLLNWYNMVTVIHRKV